MNTALRKARERAGKTQAEMAREAGISTVAYQLYEYGERSPSVDVALKLARALNSTVEELFGGKEHK